AILTGDDLEGEVTLAVTKDSHTRTTTTFDLEDGGTGVVTLRITRVSNAVTLEGTVSDGVGPVADASVLIDCGGI
ncbi:MAG: hypothetical protein GWN18_01110, partial [Thermoplasmata archaeon]|nr:hypothetical protein [Thermoplasmata archaeon]NIS10600.1 hypothetical protein [Thermoplasmata archaeon]NIS18563.1 hypothetical protein [Thermoplasmata archaeon]NIT75547.1 hypothetical protein [Thermoplasmata archaeon]NIU47714.1 hypothetical protein [Thermoplasmata archaeon]